MSRVPWLTYARLNLILTVAWGVLLPVSIVTGWIYSLAFISAISIYACVSTHFAAWRADADDVAP